MGKELLIIFVKNPISGRVKTRLAKSIGDNAAFDVYNKLVNLTEKATKNISCEKRVYFSESIIDEKWQKTDKFIQKGTGLGQKMQNSFKKGFKDGFEKIVLIGSDLPDISEEVINKGFKELKTNEVVFGPAEDGGYYLLGMASMNNCIFENKEWSTENLLKQTRKELDQKGVKYSLLEELNDIDTLEDLQKSPLRLEE